MKQVGMMRRYALFSFAFLTTALMAGIVYGWPVLRLSFLDEGSELNEKEFGAIFTIGAWSSQGGRFFAGLARDRYGTRATAFVCSLCVTLGVLGLGLSDVNNASALAASLFSVGLGSGVLLCVQPVAGLFPENSANVLFLLTGAFLMSGLVFLALTSAFASRQAGFVGYAMALFVLTILIWVVLPKEGSFAPKRRFVIDKNYSTVSLTLEDDNEDTSNPTESQDEDTDDIEMVFADSEASTNPLENFKVEPSVSSAPSALQQMYSLEYLLLCVWFSVCIVPIQYYVGSIGFQLERKGDETGFYTDMFSFIYAGASVVAPFAGYVADNFGLGVSQAVATSLAAGSLFLLAFNNIGLNAHIAGMFMYGTARLYVYSIFFSNIGKRFGYRNFGTLNGVGLLVSSVVSLLQFPLIALADDGHDVAVNTTCGVILLTLLPYCFWLRRREETEA